MRSLLFVPGDSERKRERALTCGADAVILDLEDSVAPDAKGAAREQVAAFLAAPRSGMSPRILVRVNAMDTEHFDADLEAAALSDGIVLPKACGLADIEHVSARLRVVEARAGLADGAIPVLPIVTETAAAVFQVGTLAAGHPRLAGLTWGAEDLSAVLGAQATRDDDGAYTDAFRLARALTLIAASAAGLTAIDTVYVDFRDRTGLEAECRAAARDGFCGKLAIHPDQVATINAAFTPSDEAIAEARALVEAFAAAGNPGVLSFGGSMRDRPHLERAKRLLARAGLA